MLGWEYPPHIAGGLGTACEGLTRALARQGMSVRFVMPRVFGDEPAEHMELVDASVQTPMSEDAAADRVTRYRVPAALRPYWSESEYLTETAALAIAERSEGGPNPGGKSRSAGRVHYSGDMFSEVARFTEGVLDVCVDLDFDVIHAHDWMTFPAAVALRDLTGKPMVAHIHSLEYDRSGRKGANARIREFESMGLSLANAVVAVSHYTKGIICQEYGIHHEKVHVAHNGIYEKEVVQHYQAEHTDWPKHVVLFLGRVTYQKGPDYFVRAAAKVVPHLKDVLFVVAGSGDMLDQIKQLARDLGIEQYFHFPGFLRGSSVEEMFSVADLYVMPSVSEPFGIAALEAINFDTPVLLSKQSGVSEVVGHSLKFDFWDIDRLADLIINGLLHEELRTDMIEMARKELSRVRWDASAAKVMDVYKRIAA